jgi:hypothetical protein
MKPLLESLWLAAVVGTLFFGCARSTPQGEVDPKAFDAAPPEVKQVWDTALRTAEQHDPGSAISILRALSRQKLSQEQQKTVHDAMASYEVALKDAAKRGDAAARKSLETLGYGTVIPDR